MKILFFYCYKKVRKFFPSSVWLLDPGSAMYKIDIPDLQHCINKYIQLRVHAFILFQTEIKYRYMASRTPTVSNTVLVKM